MQHTTARDVGAKSSAFADAPAQANQTSASAAARMPEDELLPAAIDQWCHAWVHVWADRDRLQHGLRHHRHDQFRPRRNLHDRRVSHDHRLHAAGHDRLDLGAAGAADRADRGDADHRRLWLDRRAARLPAAARLVPSGTADLGHRHVDLPAELRPDHPGRQRQAAAAQDLRRVRVRRRQRLHGPDRLHPDLRDPADPGADDWLLAPDQPHAARPRRSAPASRT